LGQNCTTAARTAPPKPPRQQTIGSQTPRLSNPTTDQSQLMSEFQNGKAVNSIPND